ncbi:hypothetical protein NXS19_003958 [Fusarium pseudograminearum]|nr:hypothetical protein NXS19_003958 [Fusarium pseudograminearum]
MLRVKSSRRPAVLKPTDYDHEIALVDHDAAATPTGLLGVEEEGEESQTQNHNGQNGEHQDNSNKKPDDAPANGHDDSHTEDGNEIHPSSNQAKGEQGLPPQARPSIEIQEPTPDAFHGDHPQVKPRKPRVKRETAIDILYENERGGFLCGVPLFSSQALGGLDPPAWTNGYHKASPSNIHNAQVPDPTWEWAWPEWRINHQNGVDEHGWEYSFYFSKNSRGIAESGGTHSLGDVPGPERGYERETRTFRLIHTCSTLATLRFSLRHTNRGYHMRV